MAWIRINEGTTLNLDNISSIEMLNTQEGSSIVFLDIRGRTYSSQYTSKEECRKVYELVLSKLFTNELIDISSRPLNSEE
jgi:hypothetical protein